MFLLVILSICMLVYVKIGYKLECIESLNYFKKGSSCLALLVESVQCLKIGYRKGRSPGIV